MSKKKKRDKMQAYMSDAVVVGVVVHGLHFGYFLATSC